MAEKQHDLSGSERAAIFLMSLSEKEAAELICGRPLKQDGKLAQLRARVLTLGDLKQRSATPFYDAE